MNSRLKKISLLVLGWISIVLAFAGIVLPILPTTPFLLLAAFCFAQTSEPLYAWLLNHRWFGAPIRDWQTTRTVSRDTKIKAVVLIVLSFSLTIILFASDNLWRLVLVTMAAALSILVISLPDSRPAMEDARSE